MKRVVAIGLLLAGIACGGSSSSGGGGGGGVTGTVGGASFTPADGGALAVGPVDCTIPGVGTAHVTALIVGFSSFGGLCSFVQQTGMCGDKANSTLVGFQVAKAGLFQAQAPVGPGTYTVVSNPVPDLNGNIVSVGGGITKRGASCAAPANDPEATSGRIVVSSATSSHVSGSLDVTFGDGSHLAGTFDLPMCPVSIDICAVINSTCTSPACLP